MRSRINTQLMYLVLMSAGTMAASRAEPYRVFDWQGKAAPAKPTSGPSGGGAVTHTAYLGGGQYWDGGALTPMDVSVDISVLLWNSPAKWKVDGEGFLSGGNPATYGYQSPDEAEFNFGDPTGRVIMKFDFLFSHPVDNPSFLLMDIDNNGSDHGTLFQATTLGGGTVYPTMSLIAGTTVAWTGSGPTLDVFSNGGASSDSVARGAALFEWQETGVTGISFSWESNTGTSIRVSNIYADYNPASFAIVVPEPSAVMLAVAAAGAAVMRRRR